MINETMEVLGKTITPRMIINGAIIVGIGALAIYIGVKLRRKRKQEEQRNLLFTEALSNPSGAGAKAIKLESLIFKNHDIINGWSSDSDEIIRMFLDYNRADVDKILTAYSLLYPSNQGNSILGGIGSIVSPLFGLASTVSGVGKKTYTGNAFNDILNVDQKAYDTVMYAYNQLQ